MLISIKKENEIEKVGRDKGRSKTCCMEEDERQAREGKRLSIRIWEGSVREEDVE